MPSAEFQHLAGVVVVATLGTVATIGIGAGLRHVFAKHALASALDRAQPGIKAYQAEQAALYQPLPPKAQKSLGDLRELVLVTEEMRKTARSEAAELNIPDPKKPEPPHDVAVKIKGLRTNLKKMFKSKAAKHVKHHVEHLVHHESRGRIFGGAVGAGLDYDSDTFGLDEKVIDFLDKTHIIEMTTSAEEGLDALLPDSMSHVIDDVTDIMTPGTVSAAKTAFREVGFLMEGNTSFQEVYALAIAPGAAKAVVATGGAKVGAALGAKIDILTGGLTMGLGTAAGALIGWVTGKTAVTAVQNDMIQTDLKLELDQLRSNGQAINERKHQAQATIHEKTVAEAENLRTTVAACPSLTDTPQGKILYQDLRNAIWLDANSAIKQSNQLCDQHITAIPKRNIVDKALGIDRHGAVSSEYDSAAKSFAQWARTTTQPLSLTNGLAGTVRAIEDRPHLVNGKVMDWAGKLDRSIPGLAGAYGVHLNRWQEDCTSAWQKGVDVFEATTLSEQKAVEAVEKDRRSRMGESREVIRRHLRRLGKDPNLCP